MKIDQILAAMPNLRPEELDAIRVKVHDLEVEAIKQRLLQLESEPWPPTPDPRWEAFLDWIEAQPDDDLPVDLAHNHDCR
jgi:hypothetical protein